MGGGGGRTIAGYISTSPPKKYLELFFRFNDFQKKQKMGRSKINNEKKILGNPPSWILASISSYLYRQGP